MMMLSKYFRRTLFSAAKSEGSGAGAASMASTTAHNPLHDLFEKDRKPDDEKPVYGTLLFVSIVFCFVWCFYELGNWIVYLARIS